MALLSNRREGVSQKKGLGSKKSLDRPTKSTRRKRSERSSEQGMARGVRSRFKESESGCHRVEKIGSLIREGKVLISVLEATLLTICVDAIERRQRLVLTYTSHRETTRREMEPIRIIRLRDHWYVSGWDHLREDWRSFRLDRISAIDLAKEGFGDHRVLVDDPVEIFEEEFHAAHGVAVSLSLRCSLAEAIPFLASCDGILEPFEDSECWVDVMATSFDGLLLILIEEELEFEVQSSGVFGDYVQAVACRLIRAVDLSGEGGSEHQHPALE